MKSGLYVTICLIAPAAWGVFVAYLISRLDKKRSQKDPGNQAMDMYYI